MSILSAPSISLNNSVTINKIPSITRKLNILSSASHRLTSNTSVGLCDVCNAECFSIQALPIQPGINDSIIFYHICNNPFCSNQRFQVRDLIAEKFQIYTEANWIGVSIKIPRSNGTIIQGKVISIFLGKEVNGPVAVVEWYINNISYIKMVFINDLYKINQFVLNSILVIREIEQIVLTKSNP